MRRAIFSRKTAETEVEVELTLDGVGYASLDIPIPFLKHMLELATFHGRFDLSLKAKGDIEVDYHHTVEDIGIALGKAFDIALGERKSIRRYGFSIIPMDEALSSVIIDMCFRPNLVYKVNKQLGFIKDFDTSLIKEFFKAFSDNARCTLHIIVHYGENTHHIIESIFKAFGKAIYQATRKEDLKNSYPSTKGIL